MGPIALPPFLCTQPHQQGQPSSPALLATVSAAEREVIETREAGWGRRSIHSPQAGQAGGVPRVSHRALPLAAVGGQRLPAVDAPGVRGDSLLLRLLQILLPLA